MAERFPDDVVQAVLGHMNDDHAGDSLVIVRAYGAPAATAAQMIDLDTTRGIWRVTEPGGPRELSIDWLGPVAERADLRREVVALYESARTETQPPRR